MVAIYTLFCFNFHSFIGLSGDTIDTHNKENDLIQYECITVLILYWYKVMGIDFELKVLHEKDPGLTLSPAKIITKVI